MALGTFVAGAYTATLNSVALGITEDGYEMQLEPKVDSIEKSDVYGDMLLDLIYRGTNWYFQTEFLEWKAGPKAAAYPWGSDIGVQGIIARLGSDVATSLVLTDTDNTPAATFPATLTATKAILAPGFSPRAVFTSRLRTTTCRFALLPVDVGAGVIKNFTMT